MSGSVAHHSVGVHLTELIPIEIRLVTERSALYTSHHDAFHQVRMLDCCYKVRLEIDAINQALRLSPYPHIRDVYNAERLALGVPHFSRLTIA